MRKLMTLLLTLLLLVPAFGAQAEGAVTFTCDEQGYSTLVDPGWRCEWVDGDGVYYHFGEDNMPYVLAWVNASDKRITDAGAYLDDELPELQENYSQNGAVSIARYGSFTVAGRPVAAADIQYKNSQGYRIYLLIVVDVREDFTAIFRCRYLEEAGRQQVLDALDLIDGSLTLNAAPQPQSSAPAGGTAFAVTDIEYGGSVLGRCIAPVGYQVTSQPTCSVMTLGAGNPWLLLIGAQSPDGATLLTYSSARNYMASADGDTPDEQFNADYFTPMLHYMDAGEYCDYRAAQLSDVQRIILVDEDDYPALQPTLRQKEAAAVQAQSGMLGGVALSVDRAAISMATRRYRVETTTGLTCCLCVTAVTEGVWYTASLPGPYVDINNSYILWDVPCVYMLLCPEAQADEGIAAFTAFSENTSVSDQFLLANQRLSNELWNIITGRGGTYGDDYSDRVMKEETAKGDDYDDERFTDYLFDQNDYTLSDGSHVKVSTAYDYVYEGDNGTVYYSDSAFAEPGGSTRLTPNR